MGIANNSQRGTSERIREKMMKISEKAKIATDRPVSSPLALQERIDDTVGEERQKVQRRSVKKTDRL